MTKEMRHRQNILALVLERALYGLDGKKTGDPRKIRMEMREFGFSDAAIERVERELWWRREGILLLDVISFPTSEELKAA